MGRAFLSAKGAIGQTKLLFRFERTILEKDESGREKTLQVVAGSVRKRKPSGRLHVRLQKGDEFSHEPICRGPL